jgi:hypothetical protein
VPHSFDALGQALKNSAYAIQRQGGICGRPQNAHPQ